MMRASIRTVSTLLVPALLVTACGRAATPKVDAESPRSEVGVRIDSHHWNDVVIRYYHDGVWERLGIAGAVKATNFFIPWPKLAGGGAIRLEADPVDGDDAVYTDLLPVQPGRLVVWTLERRLEQSSVGVY
jgi:hypothetical protein